MEIDISGGGWRRRASGLTAVMDEGERWCLTVAMDGSCGVWEDTDGVQWRRWRWCSMAAAALDGARGREGGARTGNATTSQHDERDESAVQREDDKI
jgi:hypothetical protein